MNPVDHDVSNGTEPVAQERVQGFRNTTMRLNPAMKPQLQTLKNSLVEPNYRPIQTPNSSKVPDFMQP